MEKNARSVQGGGIMAKGDKFIISRRCDVQMRKSKEKCNTANHTWWKCTKECSTCICGMYQTEEGDWHHNNLMSKQKLKG